MCFVLYVGTEKPLPLREWHNEAPDVSVKSLDEREEPIRVHFSKPEVQYIGSTSGCGCDFGSVMYQTGDWPWWDDGEVDPEQEQRERRSREGLIESLRNSGEPIVELYGVWDGGFDFRTPPLIRESIRVADILNRDFRFKEQGFYTLQIDQSLA